MRSADGTDNALHVTSSMVVLSVRPIEALNPAPWIVSGVVPVGLQLAVDGYTSWHPVALTIDTAGVRATGTANARSSALDASCPLESRRVTLLSCSGDAINEDALHLLIDRSVESMELGRSTSPQRAGPTKAAATLRWWIGEFSVTLIRSLPLGSQLQRRRVGGTNGEAARSAAQLAPRPDRQAPPTTIEGATQRGFAKTNETRRRAFRLPSLKWIHSDVLRAATRMPQTDQDVVLGAVIGDVIARIEVFTRTTSVAAIGMGVPSASWT